MVKPVNILEWLEAVKIAKTGNQRQAVLLDMMDSTEDGQLGPDGSRLLEKFYMDDLNAMIELANKHLGLLPTNICDNEDLQKIYREAVDNVAKK